MIGKKLEIKFISGRNGLVAEERVGGRFAFSDRGGPQPKEGDIWEVLVQGENPTGSVYFLKCLTRVSTQAEREAVLRAEQEAKEKIQDRHRGLKPQVQSWLSKIDHWTIEEKTFQLEGIEMILKPEVVSFTPKEEGIVVVIEPQVSYLGHTSDFEKVEVIIPWGTVEVKDLYLDDYNKVKAGIVTEYNKYNIFGGLSQKSIVFTPYAGEVVFKGWERKDTALFANFTLNLNGFSKEVTFKVMEFVIQWRREVKIQSWIRSGYQYEPDDIRYYIPEVPQEHLDWIQSMMDAHEDYKVRMANAGLLRFRDSSELEERDWPGGQKPDWSYQVFLSLKKVFEELGYGGLGRDVCGHNVIHPSLAKFIKDLPTVKLVPVTFRDIDDWGWVEWFHGEEPPSDEQMTALLSETIEVEEKADLQEWFENLCTQGKKSLPCNIICEETPKDHYFYGKYKYIFHAQVEAPYNINTHERYDLQSYGFYTDLSYYYKNQPILSTREVFKSNGHIFEKVAMGNEFFEGQSELKIDYNSKGFFVVWNAPETKDEKKTREVESIHQLINQASVYKIALSGWRYTDTGNPVVLVNDKDMGCWVIREYDRSTFEISKRKGFGSNKGTVCVLTPTAIRAGLNEYKSHGWPVEPDLDFKEKAGKSILSLFPDTLIKQLKGGA